MDNIHDLRGERENQLLQTTDTIGRIIGTATRRQCHFEKGIPHLAFLALLYTEEDFIFLQKRSDKKSLWNKFWDASVVSHVLPGETVTSAAKRRGLEELGVEVEFKDLGAFYYFAKYGQSCENEYCHVLVGKTDKVIHPNPVEITQTQQVKIEDLKKNIEAKPDQYTPWLKIALQKFKF
ncbi:NUDIX domain-containing protein [Candidatus Gottesmanbacteria bacterium]|nr:NUDIX domain-containing protein [Candidatus Gottesmanbacteria bacterium]